MSDQIKKLKEDIAKLEELIEKDHFGSLLDRGRSNKNHKRLKKLRKELKQLEEQA